MEVNCISIFKKANSKKSYNLKLQTVIIYLPQTMKSAQRKTCDQEEIDLIRTTVCPRTFPPCSTISATQLSLFKTILVRHQLETCYQKGSHFGRTLSCVQWITHFFHHFDCSQLYSFSCFRHPQTLQPSSLLMKPPETTFSSILFWLLLTL